MAFVYELFAKVERRQYKNHEEGFTPEPNKDPFWETATKYETKGRCIRIKICKFYKKIYDAYKEDWAERKFEKTGFREFKVYWFFIT